MKEVPYNQKIINHFSFCGVRKKNLFQWFLENTEWDFRALRNLTKYSKKGKQKLLGIYIFLKKNYQTNTSWIWRYLTRGRSQENFLVCILFYQFCTGESLEVRMKTRHFATLLALQFWKFRQIEYLQKLLFIQSHLTLSILLLIVVDLISHVNI
jgi:hypothetical protein